MRGWFESTFGAGALAAQFVVALIVVIVLFGIIAVFARRRNRNAGPAKGRGRQPRLAVMDMAVVDERRKLLLIRRDNVEHLIMIGGPSDVVVESAIIRNRPAPHLAAAQAGERVPDRTMAGLAGQVQSRAPLRAKAIPAAGAEAAAVDAAGKAAANGSGEGHTPPPVRSTQFVNPYKTPEPALEEKSPDAAATVGQTGPAATQSASPASSPAAVAGLAAGAAALTAAAATVKRREPDPEPKAPPENTAGESSAKPGEPAPAQPAGFNGGESVSAPDPQTEAPEPAATKPATDEAVANDAVNQDAEATAELVTEPAGTADVTNGATPPAVTNADTKADTDSEDTVADEMPAAKIVAEPAEAAEPALAESKDEAGQASADDSTDEKPAESQSEDTAAADAVADTSVGSDIEAALAEALAPVQDQAAETAGTSAETAADLTGAASDGAASDSEAEAVTTAPADAAAAAAKPAPAKSFEEIMAENAPSTDSGVAALPQPVAPAAAAPQTAATGEAEAQTAGDTAGPAAKSPGAISPFPTIPEDVRRSVLEAARRAEGLPDADSAVSDGDTKTTLGDLAERLEQALAEQASTLSGQLQPGDDAKPAPGPEPSAAQEPATSVEAWESGELAASGPQAAAVKPDVTPAQPAPSESTPESEPRQSQAMLEDETDSGVIDFSDRKKASPETKTSDTLEDEMARLLGELTGGSSGR